MTAQNILQTFLQNVERLKTKPCFRFKKDGQWRDLSWIDVRERVFEIAAGLKALGVATGDSVALFSSTRPEWTLCDLAILSLGGVTVPIYQSNTAEQAEFILQNSGTRVVFVEDKKLFERVRTARKDYRGLEKAILISGKKDDSSWTLSLAELQKMGQGQDREAWRKGIDAIGPTDTATIVYTSGTTGPPKGAVLTHHNILSEVEACARLFDITQEHISIIFLPLAHILARVMQFFQLHVGFVKAYAESIDKLVENIGEVRPHFFASVPRIFEKIHERVLQQVEGGSPLKKSIFSWAERVGTEISRKRQEKKWVDPWLGLRGKLATALVFKKLQKRLGGRLQFAVSGGAPLAKEIAQFFHAAGILILEGYGLTETTAAVNCNTIQDFRFGTVGKLVEGVEEKIAPDGEILVRGDVVFKGYYKNPEATREVLTPDGWFKTGDVGEIDKEGFLKITDRKKDIIVTAAGKNVAPQNIESLIKTVPFISQVMVHGDRRKFLTALVTLNREAIEKLAALEEIRLNGTTPLSKHPKIYGLVKKAIDEKNRSLASYETIKKFAILDGDFSQETGELTPTLKVKRKFVSEKYKDILDQLYQ